MSIKAAEAMALVHSGRPFVYAGGPIDYGTSKGHPWRHDLEAAGVEVFCPVCANSDQPLDKDLMMRNELGLLLASRAVFLLDGTFTVGTPVEIALRMERRHPSTVCIVHPAEPGAFVRTWRRAGAAVVGSVEEAIKWLG